MTYGPESGKGDHGLSFQIGEAWRSSLELLGGEAIAGFGEEVDEGGAAGVAIKHGRQK